MFSSKHPKLLQSPRRFTWAVKSHPTRTGSRPASLRKNNKGEVEEVAERKVGEKKKLALEIRNTVIRA